MSASVWNVPGPHGLMRLELTEDRTVRLSRLRSDLRYQGKWNGHVVRWQRPVPTSAIRTRVNRWLQEAAQEPEKSYRYPEPKEHLFLDGKPVKGDDS